MSLFQRPLQPPAILTDEAVERYLAAVRAELAVDPLFRRRLRGTIVNRFVADREGRAPARPRQRMGALGRAVLYATFALSVSVSSAMAASQGAAPGDALYPLKLQIERLRLQALPEHLHDDLAAHSLGERIHELAVLSERGDWTRAAAQAAVVEAEYHQFLAATRIDHSSDPYLPVLAALLDRLPDRAQLAVEDVLDGVRAASASDGTLPGVGKGPGPDPGGVNGGRGSGAQESGASPSVPATPEPTARPSRPDRPDSTPHASKSPAPSPATVPSANDDVADDDN